MLILNFAHPLSAEHLSQIERLAGQAVTEVRDYPVHFDLNQPFAPRPGC